MTINAKEILKSLCKQLPFGDKDATHFIGVSGGKDSMACIALAKFAGVKFKAFLCDTHHEKPDTYKYLSECLGGDLITLTRDTTESEFLARREKVKLDWAKWYTPQLRSKASKALGVKQMFPPVPIDKLEIALNALQRTGDAFRDRLVIHGTMPQKKGKFCSLELKTELAWRFIKDFLDNEHEGENVYWWSGVRSQESKAREGLKTLEPCLMDKSEYVQSFRPIYNLTHEEVFAIAAYVGIKPNPLYKKGDKRVGCNECFEANKQAIRNTFTRDKSALERISKLEIEVAKVNRRAVQLGISYIPFFRESYRLEQYGNWASVNQIFEWSNTRRGGKIKADDLIFTSCDSVYGLCE